MLSNWKACSLSLAGRLTFINAVTIAIPTHVMQCTFLWEETTQKRKIHLLSWHIVTKPKWLGGLGIKKSLRRNKALLAKCLWHIRTNPNELHTLMLKNKYPQKANASRSKSPTWASLCKVKSICDTGKDGSSTTETLPTSSKTIGREAVHFETSSTCPSTEMNTL